MSADYCRSSDERLKSIKIEPPSTSRIVSGWPIRVTGLLMKSEWNLYVVDCRWIVSLGLAMLILDWSQLPFYNLSLSLPNSAYMSTFRSVVNNLDSPKSAEFTAIDRSKTSISRSRLLLLLSSRNEFLSDDCYHCYC